MKHLIIYVPGLGDYYDAGRSFALKGWRLWGVRAKLLPIKWYGGGTYEQKLKLVTDAVRDAERKGFGVTLIGESAGASLALNAAAVLPGIRKVILIAGVNSSKLPISPHFKVRSPSFAESARIVDSSITRLDAAKVHTIKALVDPVVSPKYNAIPGATSHTFWSVGHLTTIALCLSVFSYFIARIIKQK